MSRFSTPPVSLAGLELHGQGMEEASSKGITTALTASHGRLSVFIQEQLIQIFFCTTQLELLLCKMPKSFNKFIQEQFIQIFFCTT
jgi:hypothetical protein